MTLTPFFCGLVLQNTSQQADPYLIFQLTFDKVPAGKAYIKNMDTAEGGRKSVVSMFITSGKRTVKVRTESVFGKDGSPLTKTKSTLITDSKLDETVTAKFSPGMADVIVTKGDKPTSKQFALDPSLPVKNPSVFWFSHEEPTLGTKVVYYDFDLSGLRWKLSDVTYVGKKTAKWLEREIPAFELTYSSISGTTSALLDSKGDILSLSSGSMEMVRVESDRDIKKSG